MTDRYERIRGALTRRSTPGPWEAVRTSHFRHLREHDDRNLWEFKGAYHDIVELKRGKDLDAAIDASLAQQGGRGDE